MSQLKGWTGVKTRIGWKTREEHGATLALVALGIFVLLGMVALVVDVGMLLGRRTESQRVADAAALAGAASFITAPDDPDRPRAWALEYARQNNVGDQNTYVDSIQDIDVIMDEFKVRVRVHNTAARGSAIRTIFARVLGWDSVDVATVAAAEAVSAGYGVCPLPIAVTDRWIDNPQTNDDLWNPAQDIYEPYNPEGAQCSGWGCATTQIPSDFTGYYTDDINHNLGDVIEIKTQSGPGNKSGGSTLPVVEDGNGGVSNNEAYNSSPCVAHPSWRCWWLPDGSSGASNIMDWVDGCPPDREPLAIEVGDDIEPETGNVQATLIQAFKELVDTYGGDNYSWSSVDECMTDGNGCMDPTSIDFEKRNRALPLIDPSSVGANKNDATVSQWACVFVEKVADEYYRNGNVNNPTRNGEGPPGQWNVYVRFTRCSDGLPGPESGQSLKALRLVE